MTRKRLFLFLAVLVLASLACSLFTGGGSSGGDDNQSSPGETGENNGPALPEESVDPGFTDNPPASRGSDEYDTEFPLPDDVQNFMKLDENTINYQTSMSLTKVVDFYHDAFTDAGYTERDLLTVVEDSTFSMVWDGHSSGQAIVVQGVDLGNGTTNVNVRLEDV